MEFELWNILCVLEYVCAIPHTPTLTHEQHNHILGYIKYSNTETKDCYVRMESLFILRSLIRYLFLLWDFLIRLHWHNEIDKNLACDTKTNYT